MSRPARLKDLTHPQIGVLLAAHEAPLRRGMVGWYARDKSIRIAPKTFKALERLELLTTRTSGGPRERHIGVLTARGYALADILVTVSRQIAGAVQGLPDRTICLPPVDAPSVIASVAKQSSAADRQREAV